MSWLTALAGDAETADRLDDRAQVGDMLRVEAAYARAAGRSGKVPSDMGEAAARAIGRVEIDLDALAHSAARDSVPVPGLVRQIKDQVDTSLHPAVHAGMTSQDVTDTAFLLAVREILERIERHISVLEGGLSDLDRRFGTRPLMGRTRMQAALPVSVSHRIAQWSLPWPDHRKRLEELRERLMRLQLGGPVGTRDSFDGHADAIEAEMARELGLKPSGVAWHTRRDSFAELAGWLSSVSGSLGKMGADLALMAQQGIDAVRIGGGGASSAMPHKANPVRAEVLTALARFNATQVSGMHLALEHEQERSGTAWTLEWLILPRMLESTVAGLRIASVLVGDVQDLGDTIAG